MKLYLAGIYTANFDLRSRLFSRLTDVEKQHRTEVKYLLESYHYINRQSSVDKIRRDNRQVFLDSGAFSSFTKGVEVDMPAYCQYVKDNVDIIEHIDGICCASVLDSIGSAEGTYANQVAMEKLGVRPLPCFHYGEDERYLEWYIANYDYITIGGMVPISTPQLKLWLDRIWNDYIIDGSGRPKVRVHGFGLTTGSLMRRYPWYSVDSSSWVQVARTGSIIFPETGKAFAISEHNPSRKIHNQHYDNISEMERNAVISSLAKHGYDTERLRTEYLSRWVFNMYSFGLINATINHDNTTFETENYSLF